MSEHPEHSFAGVNPCAEEPLMAGGSCLLGSLNLSEFVVHPFTDRAYFDTDKFVDAVQTAVTALNDVLDEGLLLHPLQIQRDNAYNWRQIGLGIMGLADMLIKMGIRYGSVDAVDTCQHIARTMLNAAVYQSAMLAAESEPFPKYEWGALHKSPFFQANITDAVKAVVEQYGLRNSQILTIAPTGTISTMWGISGGIEPIFAKSYTRKTESLHGEDRYYEVMTPICGELLEKTGLRELPDYVVTAADIHYLDRIMMQSVCQSYIDASISSTVNLPRTATQQDVWELYQQAWMCGLKGVTVFRAGCKRFPILEEKPAETVTTDDGQPEQATEGKNAYTDDTKYSVCDECGEPIEVVEGACVRCLKCGHSPCS